jgi:alpha-mannosidase
MAKPVVHMIGNAHIDPVWMWRIEEGREEVLSTYRSAIERMCETDEFVFTSGGAVTYRWVQQDDPELFAAIQQRVAEDDGRWSTAGGSSPTATSRVVSLLSATDCTASAHWKRCSVDAR